MELNHFPKGEFSVGRSLPVQILWYLVGQPLVQSRLIPFSFVKRSILRIFGATIGKRVVVKPGVRVKFPWRLYIGNYSWIGEDVWIDNLAEVRIGEHVCISQGAYLCTGSHDWKSLSFDLLTRPILISDHVWIGAKCSVAPNSVIREGAVSTLGSVIKGRLEAWQVYSGNPAIRCGERPRPTALSLAKPGVLFVNQSFWPDCSASAQFLNDAAVFLATRGNSVHVVTLTSSYLSNASYSSEQKHEGVSVHRVRNPFRFRSSKLGRIISSLSGNTSLLFGVLRAPPCDVLIALTSPPLLCIFLQFIAAIRGVRFVAWVFDLNPDQAVAAGWITKESLAFRLLDRAVANSLEAASEVIVLDSYMAERVKAKYVSAKNVHTVPLWVDCNELYPIDHQLNGFRQNNFGRNEFVVLFAGNLSLCHPIETILNAALLLRNDPSIVFAFSGGGPRLEEVKSFVSQHLLTNVRIFPYCAREDLRELLAAGDLHLVPMGEEFVGIVHPSKIYGILSIGRPFVFIGPKRSYIVDRFVRQGIGFHVEHGQVVELVEHIRQQQDMSEESRHKLLCASFRAAKEFDSATALEALCTTLRL